MKYLTKFWFIWLILTVVYLGFTFNNVSPGTLVSLIGLFVPYGVWNGVGLFGALATANLFPVPSGILFILVLVFFDKVTLKLGIKSPVIKIILILFTLFVLTIIVDYSIWGKWNSYDLLFVGGNVAAL